GIHRVRPQRHHPLRSERGQGAAGEVRVFAGEACAVHHPDDPGLKPKDYEAIQAIVGMWRKVGIEATIEVYEIAKHYELRAAHKLAPAAFYNWGNAIGDPTTSTGFAMFGPSPHSSWKTDDLDAKIGPLWGE